MPPARATSCVMSYRSCSSPPAMWPGSARPSSKFSSAAPRIIRNGVSAAPGQRCDSPGPPSPAIPPRHIASTFTMSLRPDSVLQIVPQLPGTFDGVGDYALNLARALSADHGITTTFLVAAKTSLTAKEGYRVISGLNRERIPELTQNCEHVILHYVNYGYQARGIPFSLRAFAQQLRSQLRGRWVTTFHELYASGP